MDRHFTLHKDLLIEDYRALRDYYRCCKNLWNLEERLKFLNACEYHDVSPGSLKFKISQLCTEVPEEICSGLRRANIKYRIQEESSRETFVVQTLCIAKLYLENTFSPRTDLTQLIKFAEKKAVDATSQVRRNLVRKLATLTKQKIRTLNIPTAKSGNKHSTVVPERESLSPPQESNNFVNLSKKVLTDNERHALKLGLKFAIPQSYVPVPALVAAVEEMISQFPVDEQTHY